MAATKATTKAPKQVELKLITGAAAITKAIDSIAGRMKKLETEIHTVAVSCLDHAAKHGDVTLMQRLVAGLGRSQRKNALLQWCLDFGPFAMADGNKELVYAKRAHVDVDKAMAKPFWDHVQEAKFVPFDMAAELDRLLSKAKKAATKGQEVPDQVFADLRKFKEYYPAPAQAM